MAPSPPDATDAPFIVPLEGTPEVPQPLPLLPLRNDVVFPNTVVPLVVGRARGLKLIDDVLVKDKMLGLAAQRQADVEEPGPDDLFPHVTVATVLKMLKFPDGSTRIICQGLRRAKIAEWAQEDPYLAAKVEVLAEEAEPGVELQALVHNVTETFNKIAEASDQVPDELRMAVANTSDPAQLSDLLASSLGFTLQEKVQLLATPQVRRRLELLSMLLNRQLQVVEISSKIRGEVQSEIGKAQREHILREQLKAIQKELGEDDEQAAEIERLRERLAKAELPKEAHTQADRELSRLARMHPSAAEYTVSRTYLDWLLELPWNKGSRDRLDIRRAGRVLDQDHYGLDKIKERILEYLSVRKLKKDLRGPILCFAGPPGTGKTSLGRSIARTLGREFVRISLGGVRDEAEIRGHRRTYVGALPGRIIQGLRKAGTHNPVFMLDEVDKLGADFRGDPSSALLEVLDPEQNHDFSDHYLEVAFDLSKVMFITTANVLETIPPPLRDRMEVLELHGYSQEEKLGIARRFLVPKQVAAHGLTARQMRFTDEALLRIAADYTREAGLRNLEREIANCCRKAARRRAGGNRKRCTVDEDTVAELLGPPRFFREVADRTGRPGVATGMAWTPAGGEVLFVESATMPGRPQLRLTGSLGEVMKESAQAALSYIRSSAKELRVPATAFSRNELHVHVPAGAISKDGPSAGLAITASLLSLLTGRPIRSELAMTGEITLNGRVLPVGGIREKVLAARRAGIKTVILPEHNRKDLTELPDDVRQDLAFRFVRSIDQAIPMWFDGRKKTVKRTRRASKRK